MRMNRGLSSRVGILGLGSLLFAPAPAAATYTASRLGTLGGQSTFVQAINNSGQMVGWSHITGTSIRHAFLFTNGTMIDLGAAL